jgi:hypothetical protein
MQMATTLLPTAERVSRARVVDGAIVLAALLLGLLLLIL